MTSGTIQARTVAASALWRAVESAGAEGLSFVFFVLMARLLAPDSFGLVALSTSILIVVQVIVNNGLTDALVQRNALEKAHIESAFIANFAVALVLVTMAFAIAWPVGWLLHRPEFPKVFLAMAPMLLIQAVNAPMHALLKRALDFRVIALRTLLGTVVAGLAALALARLGAGYWALVAQQWSIVLVSLVVLLKVAPVRPLPARLDKPALRSLVEIARPVLIGQIVINAVPRFNVLALGLFLGNHDLGLYFLVNRLIFAIQMVTQYSMTEVGLAVLSRLQGDPVRHRLAMRRSLKFTALVCYICFGSLAVIATTVVPRIFGESWLDAGVPLQILTSFATFGALVSMVGQILVSIGAANDFRQLALFSSIFQLIAGVGAAHLGLIAVAAASGIAQLICVVPAFWMAARRFQMPLSQLLFDLAPTTLTYAAAMTALSLLHRDTSLGAAAVSLAGYLAAMLIPATLVLRKEVAALRREESTVISSIS